jgi:alkyl sulfatase BDS1-like metallo-beta-lactamase superfamily hydrolase
VAGFGGRDAVIAAVNQAIEDEEFAWAARLVNHVFRLDPWDAEARALKATALREMGRRALGSIARSFFLGQARALEGKVEIPTVVVPDPAEISQGDVGALVDNFRIFIDPDRSAGVDTMLSMEFTDADEARFALIVRRGVCEFVADPAAHSRQPDLSCSLERLTWARLFVGDATPRELLASGEIESNGNLEGVARFLEVFDPFDRSDNDSIPQMPDAPGP